jgi:hypothetical protein
MKILILIASLLLLQSCATLLRKPKSKDTKTEIYITSVPPNADIYVDNKVVGKTPLSYTHTGRKTASVQIKKEGYLNEQSGIKRKINPLWTGISIIGGVFPGMGIPIFIDYSSGGIFDIKTDSISVELLSLKGNSDNIQQQENTSNQVSNQENKETSSNTSTNASNNSRANDIISFPALQILTGGYKLSVLPKTRARFYLKNGTKFGALITDVYEDHVSVKGRQDIYFNNVNKMRFFGFRLWYPIVTFPSIFPPIIWFFTGKVAEFNSSKCKWDIKDIRIIEGLPEFKYGKAKCD